MTQIQAIETATIDAGGSAIAMGTTATVAAGKLIDDWLASFDTDVAVFDVDGNLVSSSDAGAAVRDAIVTGEIARQISRSGRVELLECDEPLAIVGVPVVDMEAGPMVAVANFLCGSIDDEETAERLSRMLGRDFDAAREWAGAQAVWTVAAVERAAEMWRQKWTAEQKAELQVDQVEGLSEQITRTYEEIALLYQLLRSLDVSRNVDELARDVVSGLREVMPARGLAISLTTAAEGDAELGEPETTTSLVVQGTWPMDSDDVGTALAAVGEENKVIVVNAAQAGVELPGALRSLVRVPIAQGTKQFGWLAAVDHEDEEKEFGSVECELLTSVATILSTHLANVELFRQQGELFAGMVRALSSSIDAKDPYTCGHSDRVARVAVRLGREMGCDSEYLKTVYLSGLLHDIGKIGIEDQILRKPGRLTEEEYDHIKTHPETGYRILLGIPHLKAVLPGVRYHHEAYDGTGYPQQLAGEAIPFLGRLIAVADAFDAMSSDRPYRKGLDDEKIDVILREGAGKQWDPDVVDAFFQARDEVREIANTTPDINLSDTVSWS